MKISNEAFNKKRIQYQDYAKQVAMKYTAVLHPDTIQACIDTALWRCMQTHDDSQQAFSSSLWKYVNWECLREIKKQKCKHTQLCSDIPKDEDKDSGLLLDEYLSLLNEQTRRIIRYRYIYNHTLQEIADKEGYSRQGIQNIVQRGMLIMSKAAAND